MELTTIFYHVDNFCNNYELFIKNRAIQQEDFIVKRKISGMTKAEVISILIYHAVLSQSTKTFKSFLEYKNDELKSAFPKLLSYSRLIELKEEVSEILIMFFISLLSDCTGISFIDSTKIEACRIKRQSSHKVLRPIAAKGKTGDGWFYGMKLHLVVSDLGRIVNFALTSGNIADNNNELIRCLVKKLHGKLFADKGYILNQELWEELYKNGIKIIHGLRGNMKPKLRTIEEKLLHSKRASISETVFSILKDRMSLQYTRIRSIYSFFCNVFSMLIAYQMRPNKPSIYKKIQKKIIEKSVIFA